MNKLLVAIKRRLLLSILANSQNRVSILCYIYDESYLIRTGLNYIGIKI